MGGSVGPAFKRGFGATTGGDNVKRRGVRTGDRPVEPTAESCTYISREFMILEGEASPERAFSERPCPGDSRRESDNVPSCSTWQCLPPFCVSQRRGWRRSTTSGKRTGGGGRRTWRSAGAPAKDTPNGRRCGRVPPAPARLAARPAARQPTNNQGPVTRIISIPNKTVDEELSRTAASGHFIGDPIRTGSCLDSRTYFMPEPLPFSRLQ